MDRLSVRGGAGRSSTGITAGARLSPVPGAGNGVSFPTVLEEPTGYEGDHRGHHRFVENGFSSSHNHHHHHGDFGGEKSQQQLRAQHWRRPLMCGGGDLTSEHGRSNRSSRSFDSGMSYLVPESASPSPPPPPHISSHGDHSLFHGIPEPMGSPLLSGGGRYSSNFLTTPSAHAHSPSTTSPMTPPMRSPHRLYSTTILQRSFSTTCPQPQAQPPPLSPTFKSRSFVSRRLSDNVTPSAFTSSLSQDPYSPMLRTLSPTISRSSTVSASKSPSPCLSSRSSPILQRKRNNSSPHNSSASSARPGSGGRGILAASSSLHSNDSEDGGSPQNALSPTVPSASPSTPTPTTSSSSCSYLRGGGTTGGGRRMLPETPKMSSLEFPVSPSSSTMAAQKPSTHFGPPTSERNLAWQSLPSHDSLDSGVYSRSTTSDSNNGGGGGSSSSRGAMTSPSNGMRDPSPPSFMRQQFRRIGARLPDPPTLAASAAATQIPLGIGPSALERRKSAPPNKSSELLAAAATEGGVNGVSERGKSVTAATAVPVTSSPHRAFSRHYYHYSCYAAEVGKGNSTPHLRDAGFSPTGARGHRVHFNTFMDNAKETEEAQVIQGREEGDGANSSPMLSPSTLQIAEGNSVPAETSPHCDYADVIGEPEIDGDIVEETHELSALIGTAAVTTTTTTEELFYTNTEEDEELLADVDDDDDAFFVKDDGFSLVNNPVLAPDSPPPEALRHSSNREIAQVVNRRIRAMLTQDYSSADTAVTDVAPEEMPSPPQPIVVAALDVPKLRDLKSHSFPPPWSRLTEEEEDEGEDHADAAVVAAYGVAPEQPFGPLVIADPFYMGNDSAAARLAETCESPQAEERRRRWLLHNHAISCSGGVNGDGVARNKEGGGEKDAFDAAIAGAHQG